MKKTLIVLFIFTALLMMQNHSEAAQTGETPLYKVSVVQAAAKAINYRDLRGSVSIDFKGTVLQPSAKGHAIVRNRAGVIRIQSRFENLMPATQFGQEYLTYILWAISPDGRATNLGELIVERGKSRLDARTPLQALSLIVTAEPYFAVSKPGNVVILENAIKPDNRKKIGLIDANYELLPRGQYTRNISAADLNPQVMDKKTPFNVYQARNAVMIAKAAGAQEYAADGLRNAERLLALSETKAGGSKGRSLNARQAVQSAEDSRALAVRRQEAEDLAGERQQFKSQISSAKMQATAAEEARMKAEQAKGQSDAERTAALALAATAGAASSAAMADAKDARLSAEKSKAEADASNIRAEKAESEKAVLRANLLEQLNSVLQTNESARGLIINMSDALFQTGSSDLRPEVREKLAKVAGIISSHKGLKLSIEGHTDSVGSDEYNQRLSEKRAQSARDYLVQQGVAANSIVSSGFGKTSPIASNDTAQGRQKNRRVEVVVSGEAIGITAKAQ